MIRANDALYRQVDEFFKRRLVDHYRTVKVIAATPNPEKDGVFYLLRKEANGKEIRADSKYREMVRMQFGPFRLEVYSAVEEPPLGRIELWAFEQLYVDGPIDAATWNAVAACVKQMNENPAQEETSHGYR